MDFWNLLFNVDGEGNRLVCVAGKQQGGDDGNFVTLEGDRVVFIGGPGQGSGGSSQERREVHPRWVKSLAREDAVRYLGLARKWEPGTRREFAEGIIQNAYGIDSSQLLVLLEEDSEGIPTELYGAALIDPDSEDQDFLVLSYMTTKQPGLGRSMMNLILQGAYDQGKGIKWTSTPDSAGFYKALGFGDMTLPERPSRYVVSRDEISAWIAGQKADLALLEPQDGIFAATDEWLEGEVRGSIQHSL